MFASGREKEETGFPCSRNRGEPFWGCPPLQKTRRGCHPPLNRSWSDFLEPLIMKLSPRRPSSPITTTFHPASRCKRPSPRRPMPPFTRTALVVSHRHSLVPGLIIHEPNRNDSYELEIGPFNESDLVDLQSISSDDVSGSRDRTGSGPSPQGPSPPAVVVMRRLGFRLSICQESKIEGTGILNPPPPSHD
mmetsp:Transcript_23057/g.28346  ORF Transcript_23057/g.28346 Transcript_23057/m.28346 type:complete len:191 (-) Transcript_23057:30-602(-)